jgi:nucleotidyltransferase/DNA polymerase involved in DNA repair
MGISKVEELANCDIQRLTERFGKMGLWLKQAAHGLGFSEIEENEESVLSENCVVSTPGIPCAISHELQEKYNVELVMEPLGIGTVSMLYSVL